VHFNKVINTIVICGVTYCILSESVDAEHLLDKQEHTHIDYTHLANITTTSTHGTLAASAHASGDRVF